MSKAAADTLEKVSGEFESEILADLQEGRGQALAVVESARKEAAEMAAKAVHDGAVQSETVKRQVIGDAEMEVRNAQLKAIDEAVERAFRDAFDSMSKASAAKYEKAISHLIGEGIDAIGPKGVVWCSARDKKVVSSAISKLNKGQVKLELSPKEISTSGGVIIANANETVRFDNTFEARLERFRPTLRKEVASLLGSKT